MPMVWDKAADARLFTFILQVYDVNMAGGKLEEVAKLMGGDCTAKALSNRLYKIKTGALDVSAGASAARAPRTPGSGGKTKTPTTKTPTTGTSGKGGKNKKGTSTAATDDGDDDDDEMAGGAQGIKREYDESESDGQGGSAKRVKAEEDEQEGGAVAEDGDENVEA